MSELVNGFIKLAGDKAIETCIAETIKYLLSTNWRRDTEQGMSVIRDLDSEGAINKVSDKIKKDILTFRTLSNGGKNVNLLDVYYPLKIENEDNADVITVADGVRLDYNGVIVISGNAGQGKTTILRKLFLEEIKEKKIFPVFILLRDVGFENDTTIVSIVKDFFSGYGVVCGDDDIAFLLQSSKIKIFFDGFDEIYVDKRDKAREVIKSCWNRYNCRALVTTRPHTQIYKEPGFKNLKVRLLNSEDVEGMLKFTIEDEGKREAILKLVSSREFFFETLVTPIMIDILTISYYNFQSTPKTIADFYSSLFKNIMYSHDNHKNWERERFSGLDVDQLRSIFDAFSFLTFMCDLQTFTNDEVNKYFNESLDYIDYIPACKYDTIKIKKDIVEGTNLIALDGIDLYRYIHKSIQEYHAAKYISDVENKEVVYASLVDDFDAAKLNFLKMLQDINPVDFNKLYVLKFLKRLLFDFQMGKVNGLTIDAIINKVDDSCIIEFLSKSNPTLEVGVRIDGGLTVSLNEKVDAFINYYNRMVDLLSILSPDEYLEKIHYKSVHKNGVISLRKTNLLEEKVLIDVIKDRAIFDKLHVQRLVADNGISGSSSFRYMISVKIKDIYNVNSASINLEGFYEKYLSMVNFFNSYYEEYIKESLNTKRSSEKVMNILKRKKTQN